MMLQDAFEHSSQFDATKRKLPKTDAGFLSSRMHIGAHCGELAEISDRGHPRQATLASACLQYCAWKVNIFQGRGHAPRGR